jgi:hypothetical protein
VDSSSSASEALASSASRDASVVALASSVAGASGGGVPERAHASASVRARASSRSRLARISAAISRDRVNFARVSSACRFAVGSPRRQSPTVASSTRRRSRARIASRARREAVARTVMDSNARASPAAAAFKRAITARASPIAPPSVVGVALDTRE